MLGQFPLRLIDVGRSESLDHPTLETDWLRTRRFYFPYSYSNQQMNCPYSLRDMACGLL